MNQGMINDALGGTAHRPAGEQLAAQFCVFYLEFGWAVRDFFVAQAETPEE
jgi:hypothetical protein